jgi:hypothetical protein
LRMLSKSQADRPSAQEVYGEVKAFVSTRQCSTPTPEMTKYCIKKCENLTPDIIQYCPRLAQIRSALRNQVKLVLNTLLRDVPNMCPQPGEKEGWYSTVLLRPWRKYQDKYMFGYEFYPIYFTYRLRADLVAFSDWLNTPALLAKPLPIQKCCSGLPIEWYQEQKQEWYDELKKSVVKGSDGRIRYILLSDVRYSRLNSSTIIGKRYALDNDAQPHYNANNAVGWELKNVSDKQVHYMSNEIETELLVPIYDPANHQDIRTEQEIMGVANFEWNEKFKGRRLRTLCEQLSSAIQDKQVFPLSRLSCEVMDLISRVDIDK